MRCAVSLSLAILAILAPAIGVGADFVRADGVSPMQELDAMITEAPAAEARERCPARLSTCPDVPAITYTRYNDIPRRLRCARPVIAWQLVTVPAGKDCPIGKVHVKTVYERCPPKTLTLRRVSKCSLQKTAGGAPTAPAKTETETETETTTATTTKTTTKTTTVSRIETRTVKVTVPTRVTASTCPTVARNGTVATTRTLDVCCITITFDGEPRERCREVSLIRPEWTSHLLPIPKLTSHLLPLPKPTAKATSSR